MVIPAHEDVAVRLGLVGARPTRTGKPQRIGCTPYVPAGRYFPSKEEIIYAD